MAEEEEATKVFGRYWEREVVCMMMRGHISAVASQAHRAAMVRWGCEFDKVGGLNFRLKTQAFI
jgi:hypothetical protein